MELTLKTLFLGLQAWRGEIANGEGIMRPSLKASPVLLSWLFFETNRACSGVQHEVSI